MSIHMLKTHAFYADEREARLIYKEEKKKTFKRSTF